MGNWIRPLLKVISLLILIPSILVYFHLRRTLFVSNYCLIGPPSASSSIEALDRSQTINDKNDIIYTESISGIYALQKSTDDDNKGTFLQIYSTFQKNSSLYHDWITQYGWPSAPILASELIRPISHLSSVIKSNQPKALQNMYTIEYQSQEERWCVLLNNSPYEAPTTLFCSETISNNQNGFFLPSGYWISSSSSSKSSLQVTCPSSISSTSKRKKGRGKTNKNLEFILSFPTTCFVIALNVGLAYYYWNHRISPTAVAKNYDKIVNQKEIWRTFAGALAHFELLHLGFNMSSMISLGEALEQGGYGSLPFLSLNISLVVFTGICMMLITKARIYMSDSTGEIRSLKERNTVGYSGVLFAWMVIVSMEREKSCPVFFLPEMCFETFHLYKNNFKFNIAPLVALGITQVILPRASFVGHLSGIMCGYALHWGVLRLGFCVPHVLGCSIIFIWLWKIEKVIPICVQSTAEELLTLDVIALDDDDEVNEAYDSMRQVMAHFFSQRASVQERTISHLQLTSYGLIGSSLLSVLLFDWGIIFCECISAYLFYIGTTSFINVDKKKQNCSHIGHILRGYIIAALLLLVADGMNLPGWWIARVFIISNRTLILSNNVFFVFMISLIRISLNIWGLILAVKVLADVGEINGGTCYKVVLGWILNNLRIVGNEIIVPIHHSFEGQGRVLGTVECEGQTSRSGSRFDSDGRMVGTGFQRVV